MRVILPMGYFLFYSTLNGVGSAFTQINWPLLLLNFYSAIASTSRSYGGIFCLIKSKGHTRVGYCSGTSKHCLHKSCCNNAPRRWRFR